MERSNVADVQRGHQVNIAIEIDIVTDIAIDTDTDTDFNFIVWRFFCVCFFAFLLSFPRSLSSI